MIWSKRGFIDQVFKTSEALEKELTAVTEQRDRLDDQLDQILIRLGKTQEKMFDAEKQRDSEKELADLLAEALKATRWDSPVLCDEAMTAWESARKDSLHNASVEARQSRL